MSSGRSAAGAGRVLIGSLAAADPRLVGELAATTGRVAVAADCRDGSIRTHGWEQDSEQIGRVVS